jgi:2-dehydro-3-deoxygalactonokinase
MPWHSRMRKPYSILGDWGTSRLRLFRLEQGVIVDRITGAGIGAISQAPAVALRQAIAPWLVDGRPEHMTLCGMAGSRNGLLEAPYAECPVSAQAWSRQSAVFSLDGIPVQIMAGLACVRANGAPDVMRGEETQIFGALALAPELAQGRQLLALPGTHGKWAWLENGCVMAFQTFLSGELFALLCDHSTLLRAGDNDADEADGFAVGCASAGNNEALLGALFHARSAQLRSGRSAGWARAYLSGLIIGHEIREMLSAVAADTPISLIGDPALNARYADVLKPYDVSVTQRDGEQCAIAGLMTYKDDP